MFQYCNLNNEVVNHRLRNCNCEKGCKCKPGMIRNENDGECIAPEDCKLDHTSVVYDLECIDCPKIQFTQNFAWCNAMPSEKPVPRRNSQLYKIPLEYHEFDELLNIKNSTGFEDVLNLKIIALGNACTDT